jgi:DNA (cytosine-5)-methyltransferase 1
VNGLAICSGIGGLELGIKLANAEYTCVCHIEREAFPASIMVQRMEEGLVDMAPIWSDIGTFDCRPWDGIVDILSGGFPCQPWSAAGKRKGATDSRWIWDDIARIIRAIRSLRYIFLENVPGIVNGGLEYILWTLAESGFDAEWDLFRASDVGAPHKRERWFLLAYSDSARFAGNAGSRDQGTGREAVGSTSNGCVELADSGGEGLEERRGFGENIDQELSAAQRGCFDLFPPGPGSPREAYPAGLEPAVCRVANGIPNRVDRLRALGNGVVPRMVALAWNVLFDRIHNNGR